MKIPAVLLLLLALAASFPLAAQTADPEPPTAPATPAQMNRSMPLYHKPNPKPPPPELAGPIDKFFKTLASGDYVGAYDNLLAGTRLGTQTEKKSFFISKTQEAFGIYGKLNDYEVFDNYSVGSNVIVITCLSRQPVQPLLWRFIFYRPDKTWGLINMGIDDALPNIID